MSSETLTPKQLRFIEEYTLDHNGAAAARRAGYSENSAKQIASENLTKPDVIAAIEERERDIANELGITRERILRGFEDVWTEAKADRNWSQCNRSLENLARLTGMLTGPGFDGLDPAVQSDVDQSIRRLLAEFERRDPA